ncbi:MAG: leucine-rich repeat domain-containing protein [Phaeodactylibacter sp.]|nr:leucine-rich repeat domain-containing protein [Phaeodactylibacter sp.]MCB9047873.1 leucine-rich repeat domain-containing protein [Lewinellaceae bacterium]
MPDFSKRPNLRGLWCSGNQLTGGIPEFSNLPNLEVFQCFGNQLSDSIPDLSDNGKVVIRTGAIGLPRVKNICRPTYNDPEEITIEAVSVQAADGQQLKLNGSEQTIRGQFSNQPSVLQIGTPLIANVMNNSSILVD